jgi:hypothetical protein
MVWKLTIAAGLAALAATGPVSAENTDAGNTAAALGAAKEKQVCRTQKVTGSLARKRRICMTQAQWDELAAQTKQSIDEYGSNASGGPGVCDPMRGGRC